MTEKLKAPRLPESIAKAGSRSVSVDRSSASEIAARYADKAPKRSNLMGLSDATGSMAQVWAATRSHVEELVVRSSALGRFRLRWVAYRDYCDGADLIEASPWHDTPEPLLRFINDIRTFGGGDKPEAVERALEFAVRDPEVTRVVLIGDAPPHAERDYIRQARHLAQQKRPVFAFVVGNDPETMRAFEQISSITCGRSAHLTSVEDLLDVLIITVADDMGGASKVQEYLAAHGHLLSPGGRRFATQLLDAGKK